jgi:hypothetical protein
MTADHDASTETCFQCDQVIEGEPAAWYERHWPLCERCAYEDLDLPEIA